MLFQATLLVDITAMGTCLWMAFYLFARGFPSSITLRGAILLAALSAFFFGAYNNLFNQVSGTAAWRAVFLITGLTAWHDITLHLLPEEIRRRKQSWTIAVYLLGFVSILLLLGSEQSFINEQGNALHVARIGFGPPYLLYGLFEIIALISILYNLLAHERVGLTPVGKYFLFASFFAVAGVGYGIIALALSPPMPRIIQDFMIFSGVFMIGISVARQQSLVERRTTLQDFPVTSLTVFLITLAYVLIALRFGLPLPLLAILTVFVVLTHSLYDLVREFLERLHIQHETMFRKQIRQLESADPRANLSLRFQEGLDLLCQTLGAFSGFIAVKRGEEIEVTASRQSVRVESRFPLSALLYDDVFHGSNEHIPGIHYFVPVFDGQTQIAVVGIGKPETRLDYSQSDLALLLEVADHVGTMVSLSNIQFDNGRSAAISKATENEMNYAAGEMLGAMEIHPDDEFIKLIEESLRHVSDYILLGQSALADNLGVQGGSHIERGRELQKIILASIELLRPAEKRPPEPLPRVWYNHAVLHDAYVEGVPNREIMARLYISEGTFNRTRRNAIRGLARLLMEKKTAVK